jgi:hypothetical protein
MPSPRVFAITKDQIAAKARTFRWTRQMPKWSVIVDGRELPARPLVLEVAGVPPNDPTNSHQAVAILKERGFEIRYQGKTTENENEVEQAPSQIEDLIRKLRGSLKGPYSLLDDREREHRIEKNYPGQ